jgi:protein phosphatase
VPLKINVFGKSDVGLVRSGNEDYLHIDEANQVFAVCDGMGGHQAGEVASMSAAQIVGQVFESFASVIQNDPALAVEPTLPEKGSLLVKAIRLANRFIYKKADSDGSMKGMGTTIVATAFEGNTLSVVHVGDSRAYRLDKTEIRALTRDHSWVAEIAAQQDLTDEEAENLVGKNVITRALGVRSDVEVDISTYKVSKGEKFILCSDGLCGFADDDEIFRVAAKYRDDNKKMVEELIQMANDRGGSDNVTVIVVELVEVGKSDEKEIDPITIPAETRDILAIEDQWLEKLQAAPEPKKKEPAAAEPKNKILVTLIFVLFAIVAAVIIWQTTSQ